MSLPRSLIDSWCHFCRFRSTFCDQGMSPPNTRPRGFALWSLFTLVPFPFFIVTRRFGWRVFAWVLMDNHFHLFLQTPEANLSAGMHDLNSGYATCFNRRHRRVGSLYQGRFKAILVEDESYGWTLSRYVHLNPVRAKMVNRPEAYTWSSYQYYLRSRGAPDWLDSARVLAEIGKSPRSPRNAYRRFVEQGLDSNAEFPWDEVVGRVLLGSSRWVARMQEQLGFTPPADNVPDRNRLLLRPSIECIEAAVAEEFDVEVPRLMAKRAKKNDARSAALYLIRQLTSEPVTVLAQRYGDVSPAAISKTVQRAEARRATEQSWDRRISRLMKSLPNTTRKPAR